MSARRNRGGARGIGRAARAGAGPSFALALAFALAAPAAGQELVGPEEDLVRSYSIPETRLARELFDRAREHLSAERWPEAIAVLQELVSEHRGDVLGPTFGSEDGGRARTPVHHGVAEAARRALFELPPKARALYRERHAAESSAALDAARRSVDRRALVEVARRWPISAAARSAWWTVGDLELELGNPAAARDAWQRARALAELDGGELGSGALARLGYVATADDGALPSAASASALRLPGSGEAVASAPGPEAHSWSRLLDDGLRGLPFGNERGGFNLFPALAGDTLLVTNSLTLFAFDAWTGRERWRSAEPPGWDLVDSRQTYGRQDGQRLEGRAELFEAIDYASVVIAPATAGGIVVAPLQIPMTQLGNTHYQNIPITRAIPDRRLFAFDVETGRELWNHMPPPLWDGESGRFEERMRVAAPPVVAGTRVIVPAYRMQGRIDYHLACYDLFSGELLWSTALISGQLPLNMFGRHQTEFAAAPVRVEGERVYAVTQLGAVAACDLYTGEVLWETLYEQIPLPPTMNWAPSKRGLDWRNAPPVVASGVLIATPLDSHYLIGLDAETGNGLWRLRSDGLQLQADARRRGPGTRLALLGADGDTVYLAGRSIVACRAPGGLSSRAGPIDVTVGVELSADGPRPALGARHVVAPTSDGRIAIDRFNLRFEDRQASAEWEPDQGPGNALLGDGALFLVSNRHVTAIFDWDVLEARAAGRFAAEPDDDAAALSYAELLAGRARSEYAGTLLSAALEHLAEARTILEQRLADPDGGFHGELRGLLHQVLRDEARALARSGRPWSQVLELLQQAESTAPGPEALRDTLLETVALLDRVEARADWLSALDRLAARCAELPMPPADEFAGADLAGRERGLSLDERARPTPVGLWVAVERVRDHARAGSSAAELEVLHGILADFGDAPLEGLASDLHLDPSELARMDDRPLRVSDRISALIAARGPELYRPFEERARAALESALASGSGEVAGARALEQVIARFPHSAAARRATEERVASALAEGDSRTVVELVRGALPERWSPRTAEPRELELLLALGLSLEREGNVELADRLVAELAALHPDLVPTRVLRGEDGGRSLAERAAAREARRASLAVPELPPIDFDRSAGLRAEIAGQHDLLATCPPATGVERPGLLLTVLEASHFEELTAFAETDPTRPLWFRRIDDRVQPDRRRAVYISGERAVVAGSDAVLGIDLADGAVRWAWNADRPRGVLGVAGDAGVAVAVLGDPRERLRLRAFDAHGSELLWSRSVDPTEHWPLPVVGSGRACLLPYDYSVADAIVLDLVTGKEVARFPVDPVDRADHEGAWIEAGALILPRFPKTSSTDGSVLECFDLETGRRRWTADNPEGLEFDSVARAGGQAYLVFSAGRQKPGALKQVDTRLGAVRTLAVSIRPGDVPIGMDRHRVTQLPGDWLYLQSRSDRSASETIVRAVHLPFGEKWSHRLPVAPSQIYDGLPMPVTAGATTLLAWTEPAQDLSVGPMTQLLFLDRESGALQHARSLDRELGSAGILRFATLGSAVVVFGKKMIVLAR